MIRAAILTISDKGYQGQREDVSGQEIRKALQSIGAEIVDYRIVPDERAMIEATLKSWADEQRVDLVLTTGGTGLSPRDVTPEATLAVIDKEIPAIPMAILVEGIRKTPRAMLSRAVAGVRGRTLIINLPGSPRAVRENLDVVLPIVPHAIEIITGQPTDHA
ncbi:MAG: MogA/MoaB family molybdenum cofactor biosynthesis protein [Chloroflexi bacterium]|nr:MogA/MoaB family molybdenum cofactor biosynthesis protein [Chloroflexota bacterium]MDA8187936.1 MogA/MoaB family molybdenum cofactor biosynthesis protein [Dehalococcoidales bacterium]